MGKGKKLIGAVIVICFLFFLQGILEKKYNSMNVTMVMGGLLTEQAVNCDVNIKQSNIDVEKYFRPSNLPVLNDRFSGAFISQFFGKSDAQIQLPSNLFNTPEDTIINYFSILREAANPIEGKGAGCGTIGMAKLPYPIAYNFLSKEYKETLDYQKYLNTFKNILHISLIKYREVPVYENPNNIQRYFVELETIEGGENNKAVFTYYYGFVDLVKEGDQYKISNFVFTQENYLCAPYHGWSYDAELSVQIRYGGWCKLIEKLYPTKQKDYVKNVSFLGTDGKEYCIVFYQLTNDTDIEIAQYQKKPNEKWKLIQYNPEDCLKNNKSSKK